MDTPGTTGRSTTPDTTPLAASENTEASLIYSRDPQYYFEDGSIVLLLDDIHASLIKAESQVFKDMFAMPNDDNSGTDGASDERPVIIPQVKPTQFRSLMKMFYCPPSSRFFISLRGDDPTKVNVASWDNFNFYLDVASLSHRFAMASVEQWAKDQLTQLFSALGERIIDRSQWDHSAVLVFLDAIRYAQIAQDRQLANDLTNLLQYFLSKTDWTALSELLRVFRIPNLRADHPSLHGFLFILFMKAGRETWMEADFTKVDRMALYYGLVGLTPLPESLKASIRSPLFSRLTDLDSFRMRFVPDPSNPILPDPCEKGCDEVMTDLWSQEFGGNYYKNIICDRINGPTVWLSILPGYRLKWAKKAREKLKQGKCRLCYVRYIDQLDQDLELLFSQVGEYYQEIE